MTSSITTWVAFWIYSNLIPGLSTDGRVRLQKNPEALGEIIDVRHLRQHICAIHQVGVPALLRQSGCERLAKKLGDRFDAFFASNLCYVPGGLYTQHRDFLRQKVLQQVPILFNLLSPTPLPIM